MANNIQINVDEGTLEASDCTCDRKKACATFSEFMRSLQVPNENENMLKNQSKIRELLKKDEISLATRFCWRGKKESILKTLLEEVPEGCHIIRG